MIKCKKYAIVWALFFCHQSIFSYGLPSLRLGYNTILEGGPLRPRPGIYLFEWSKYYTTQRFLNAEGKPLDGVPSPRFREWTITSQIACQFGKQPLLREGMPGLTLGVPFVAYSKIEKNELDMRTSGTGFGNLRLAAYIQWPWLERNGEKFFIHRLEFDMSVPMGKNKLPEKQINPQNPFVYLGPNWSATIVLAEKWTTSWSLHYVWSAKNEKIDFQAGDAFYGNYAVSYQALPGFYISGVGYVLAQLHDNKAFGISEPKSKTRLFASGPGMAYYFSPDIILLSYLYLEYGAKNSTEGTNFIVRLVCRF